MKKEFDRVSGFNSFEVVTQKSQHISTLLHTFFKGFLRIKSESKNRNVFIKSDSTDTLRVFVKSRLTIIKIR